MAEDVPHGENRPVVDERYIETVALRLYRLTRVGAPPAIWRGVGGILEWALMEAYAVEERIGEEWGE